MKGLSFLQFVCAAALISSVISTSRAETTGFVRTSGTTFVVGQHRYGFVGANFWYGAYLGANIHVGERERLKRELDRLQALGVTNLRVAASSEGDAFTYPLTPPFEPEPGVYNETLLKGLDILLAEFAKRDMRVVLILNNYWNWTGGMAQYVAWADNVSVPDPDRGIGTWTDYERFTSHFYQDRSAQEISRRYIARLIGRTNSVTGVVYRNDPAIMAWELANEPRPGNGADGADKFPDFLRWIDETARFIHTMDPNHLVTTGSEGSKGCLDDLEWAFDAHESSGIDYVSVHLWPKNWGWFDGAKPETLAHAQVLANSYLTEHASIARRLNKPAVLEEFGLARDANSVSPEGGTRARNAFYHFVLGSISASIRANGPFAGSNFWGWGGEGRPLHVGGKWQPGDLSYTADPYAEPQGLNSVFDSDRETNRIVGDAAADLKTALNP